MCFFGILQISVREMYYTVLWRNLFGNTVRVTTENECAYFACPSLPSTAVRSGRKPRGIFFRPNHFCQAQAFDTVMAMKANMRVINETANSDNTFANQYNACIWDCGALAIDFFHFTTSCTLHKYSTNMLLAWSCTMRSRPTIQFILSNNRVRCASTGNSSKTAECRLTQQLYICVKVIYKWCNVRQVVWVSWERVSSYLKLCLGDGDCRRRSETVDNRMRYILDNKTWQINRILIPRIHHAGVWLTVYYCGFTYYSSLLISTEIIAFW